MVLIMILSLLTLLYLGSMIDDTPTPLQKDLFNTMKITFKGSILAICAILGYPIIKKLFSD